MRLPLPQGETPEFGLYLLGADPGPMPWPSRWLEWPDFRLPKNPAEARDALLEVWRRSATERVEVACHGGRGRTGTALACIAVLDGISAAEAIEFVRTNYDRHAVETRGQRRFVSGFG